MCRTPLTQRHLAIPSGGFHAFSRVFLYILNTTQPPPSTRTKSYPAFIRRSINPSHHKDTIFILDGDAGFLWRFQLSFWNRGNLPGKGGSTLRVFRWMMCVWCGEWKKVLAAVRLLGVTRKMYYCGLSYKCEYIHGAQVCLRRCGDSQRSEFVPFESHMSAERVRCVAWALCQEGCRCVIFPARWILTRKATTLWLGSQRYGVT